MTGNAAATGGTGLSNEGFFSGYPNGSSLWGWSFANWSLNVTYHPDKYFQFKVDLTDYSDISFSFAERRSGTGPLNFVIHYSLDGANFTPIT